MLKKSVPVYSGDHFEVCTQYVMHDFQDKWVKGAITERKMPIPTVKKPDRVKTVYYWIGEESAESLCDLSLEMPPMVTELAAEGFREYKAFALSYRGIMMGNGSRELMVPA